MAITDEKFIRRAGGVHQNATTVPKTWNGINEGTRLYEGFRAEMDIYDQSFGVRQLAGKYCEQNQTLNDKFTDLR
jgi:hypothetical protein